MKQLEQSFIIGIFGLIGLFIGLFVKNIMVWTLKTKRKLKNKNMK